MATNDLNAGDTGVINPVIETQGHTTPDGMLNLSIPVGLADADVAVVVHVRPVAANLAVDTNGWPRGYFEEVPGSMPGLERPPQGEFEHRVPLE